MAAPLLAEVLGGPGLLGSIARGPRARPLHLGSDADA